MDKDTENIIMILADWSMDINGIEAKSDDAVNADEAVAVMVKR